MQQKPSIKLLGREKGEIPRISGWMGLIAPTTTPYPGFWGTRAPSNDWDWPNMTSWSTRTPMENQTPNTTLWNSRRITTAKSWAITAKSPAKTAKSQPYKPKCKVSKTPWWEGGTASTRLRWPNQWKTGLTPWTELHSYFDKRSGTETPVLGPMKLFVRLCLITYWT